MVFRRHVRLACSFEGGGVQAEREQPVLPQAEASTGLEVCFEAARTLSEGGLQCW